MAGASGGPIRQTLIPGLFLMARWWGNRGAGAMECWITAPSANRTLLAIRKSLK
jgi:hypothetical protein